MSKQTAVEFLINEISDILGRIETTPMQDLLMLDAVNKAKEMEKQQIIDACNQIEVIGLDNELPGKKYYNQNFNK
jgi:hypothetical protein